MQTQCCCTGFKKHFQLCIINACGAGFVDDYQLKSKKSVNEPQAIFNIAFEKGERRCLKNCCLFCFPKGTRLRKLQILRYSRNMLISIMYLRSLRSFSVMEGHFLLCPFKPILLLFSTY